MGLISTHACKTNYIILDYCFKNYDYVSGFKKYIKCRIATEHKDYNWKGP